MRDAKKPGAKFFITSESADVAGRVDEGFLNDIQARLLIVKQFKDITVKRQLVAFEQGVPRLGIATSGCGHRQLFALRHHQHLY
jgi:hypothetical protein